jgi:hypothetical protein
MIAQSPALGTPQGSESQDAGGRAVEQTSGRIATLAGSYWRQPLVPSGLLEFFDVDGECTDEVQLRESVAGQQGHPPPNESE